ncbi:MAG TPA: efflux RND transporter periplasmic adaptor subunit, partial [Acetobacteraceae bacterium]|nr:efflux RND transporter periplasmic adaptor subunit [Acetobacteraceae bacterium]
MSVVRALGKAVAVVVVGIALADALSGGRMGAAAALSRWWQAMIGAEASPLTAAVTTIAQAQAPPTIPVVRPKEQTVSESLEITGNAAAVNQVKLIARVVGFLEKIHFQDGALVRKNDLLFTVQQDQYRAQLQQAQAQLQLQQAALLYAKTEVVRYTALLKRDAATQVDVDHWNFERASAEANIQAAQAQIALAQLNLGYTEIRAPFDGQMG